MAATADQANHEIPVETVAPSDDHHATDNCVGDDKQVNTSLHLTSALLPTKNPTDSIQDTAAEPQHFPISSEPNPLPRIPQDGNYCPAGYIFSDREESSGDDWDTDPESETESDRELMRF
jgi:hypothetical protein